jgi:hypothetical protein
MVSWRLLERLMDGVPIVVAATPTTVIELIVTDVKPWN